MTYYIKEIKIITMTRVLLVNKYSVLNTEHEFEISHANSSKKNDLV